MNIPLQFLANLIIKIITGGGMLPDSNWKTWAGIAVAVAGVAVEFLGGTVPVLGNDWTTLIGSLLAAFGLGDKAGRAGGKAI